MTSGGFLRAAESLAARACAMAAQPVQQQATVPKSAEHGLRVAMLASGSKGNAAYIELDGTRLLIDAGISARAHDRRPAGQHDPGDRHQGLEPPDQGGPSTVRGAGGGAVHQDISYRGQSYRRLRGSPRRPAAIDGEGQDRWDPEILLLSPPMV